MIDAWDGRPQNPEQSGAHRLRHHGSDLEWDALWSCGGTWLDLSGGFSTTHAAAFYDYLGPCLTPAEVAAREAAAWREGIEAAAREMECGCPDEAKTAVLAALRDGHNSGKRWQACGHSQCSTIDAFNIRALLEDGR